ncbi:MAG: ABC transporter ATP-binding protein [Acidobacteriota bacterium]
MSRTIVHVDNLVVRYGRRTVLDGVSLDVAEGQVLALLGRNGIGKSSLVRCVLGQQVPSAGSCRLFGESSLRHRARLMQRVGAVPEVPDAPPQATAARLGAFARRLHSAWSDDLFNRRLERFGISPDTPFLALSRGQKTQVMLALALAPRPDLLVLDDPTLGLDAVARRVVIGELVDELAERGTPMLIASHDLVGLERLATRLTLVVDGRVALREDLDALKQRLRWITFAQALTDAELAPLAPISSRPLPGRGQELLVDRFDEALVARLEQDGRRVVDVRFATLEDLIVATTDERSPQEVSR